jgi:hypothetical protein
MIGDFVNDSKRTVEDAYNWNALTDTLTATTSNALFSYSLTDSGQRFRVIDVINDTSNWNLKEGTTRWFNDQFLNTVAPIGSPQYYNFNGVDSYGDTMVDVFPIPDGVYSLRFNLIIPQGDLTNNTDILKVPSQPVIFLAYARALAERGEDGGLASSEAYGLYKTSLADSIALESGRYAKESQWYWV